MCAFSWRSHLRDTQPDPLEKYESISLFSSNTKLTQGIISQKMSLCKAATLISHCMPCDLQGLTALDGNTIW